MALDPNARLLLDTLKQLELDDVNVADAIKAQKTIIAVAEEEIRRLEAVADLCSRTATLSTTGRKKRRDANKPRGPRNQTPAPEDNPTSSESQ